MATTVTMPGPVDAVRAFLTAEIADIRDVRVEDRGDQLGVIVPTRPMWADLFLLTWIVRDREQAIVHLRPSSRPLALPAGSWGDGATDEVQQIADGEKTTVELESVNAERWLYVRLVKLLEDHSIEQALVEARRRESPFSMENMWGAPAPLAPGEEPPDRSLGFGDFFGGPPSKPAARKAVDPAGPGAFTRARDAGLF